MSCNLQQQMRALKAVAAVRSKEARKKQLGKLSGDPSFTKALRELCLNLVKRNLPLDEHCKKKIQNCKRQIKCCAKDGASIRTRKKQIIEAATYLPHLVPFADSYLKSNRKKLKLISCKSTGSGEGIQQVTSNGSWSDSNSN